MDKVRVVVEIPKDCDVKYEIKGNDLLVDRTLKVKYPFNYGFIPETLWEDGDPLDVIIVGHYQILPTAKIDVKPIALVEMYDAGESDYKLVCAFNGEKFEEYWEVIRGFLLTYKPGTQVDGYTTDPKEIQEALQKAKVLYEKQ